MVLVQEGTDLANGATVTITNGTTVALTSSVATGTLNLGAVGTDTPLNTGASNMISATFNPV